MSFSIQYQDDMLLVAWPDMPRPAAVARDLRGKWLPATRAWAFAPQQVDDILNLYQEHTRPDARVDVEVTFMTACTRVRDGFHVCGRQIARPDGTGHAVTIAPDVFLRAGGFTVSGAAPNWIMRAEPGTTVLLRAVPRNAVIVSMARSADRMYHILECPV